MKPGSALPAAILLFTSPLTVSANDTAFESASSVAEVRRHIAALPDDDVWLTVTGERMGWLHRALVAEEAAAFGAEVSGEQTRVRGEPRLLRHLVHNLLENARRHAGGSEVCVEVAPLDEESACLRVSDRGPGIAAEEREAVFEPFYQPADRPAGSDRGVGIHVDAERPRQPRLFLDVVPVGVDHPRAAERLARVERARDLRRV